jgi:hypothetical protein
MRIRANLSQSSSDTFPLKSLQKPGVMVVIFQAYKNHWVLRTSPDDWFFPVIRRIAQVLPTVQVYVGSSAEIRY